MKDKIAEGLTKAGVRNAECHLFFCIGPDCCRRSQGEQLWDFAKQRLKDCRLPVMRTKAGCFRICHGGPWLVIYPEGTWYGNVTCERFERILQEHILNGRPVKEWASATNPLRASGSDSR